MAFRVAHFYYIAILIMFKSMKKLFVILVLVGSAFCLVTSCSKSDDWSVVQQKKVQGWSLEVYNVMQQLYLWNSALPATFDARKYATPVDALAYLRGIKINSETNMPIDRYSFLDKIGGISGEIEGGIAGDYGFMVKYPDSKAGTYPYVVYVYKASPAAAAQLYRGLKLVKVGGNALVTIDGTDDGGAGLDNVSKSLFHTSSSSFTFERLDGTTFTVSLSTSNYKINSVLLDTVYVQDAKKIGYLVFNQFLEAPSMVELRETFSKFQGEGISDLIVDLRYNGGGSVSTCNSLSSMIAPRAATGQVMNYTIYNKGYTDFFMSKNGDEYFIARFKKEGSLDIPRVFFIVSKSTASASELLINNLKPFMEVNLIGKNTYGKPCGFWRVPIGYSDDQTGVKEGYDLYAISFETINSKKEGGYYSGMAVNKEVDDGYLFPWGDINENRLAEALYFIKNGSYRSATKSGVKSGGIDIDRQFKGMIDFRKHLK